MAKIPVRIFKKSDASAEYEVPVEADVMRWFKKEGDTVREGDELCELEAEKGSFSMEAPVSGKVADIRYPLKPGEVKVWKRGKPEQVGDTFFYDPPLCFIEVEEGEAAPKEEKREKQKPKITADAFRMIQEFGISLDGLLRFYPDAARIEKEHVERYIPVLKAELKAAETPLPRYENDVAVGAIKAVPAARAKAKELGVDLAALQGSGPNGAILVSDVEEAAKKKDAPSREELVHLAAPRLWRTIAKNMDEGARIPTADADMRFDFSQLLEFYRSHRERLAIGLWFPVVAALVRVLGREEFLLFNAYWDAENEEKPVVIRKAVHMGLAFDRAETPRVNSESGRIEGERLKILVLHNAGTKSLARLAGEIQQLLRLAVSGKVPQEQLSGHTFIFNNIGALGHERGRSILSGKISAMVNFGRIDAVTKSGILQIVFDHRLIDGAPTAPFLRAVWQEMTEQVIPELTTLFERK